MAHDGRDLLDVADRLGFGLMVLADGQIAAANSSAAQVLGVRSQRLEGKSVMEAFVDHTVEELVHGATSGPAATTEITLAGEPQRTLRVSAWKDADGQTWIALEDVSELQRLRRIRTEFIDNLSHELRTPLTTLRLLAETLGLEASREQLPARVSELIAKIDAETDHLAQMVSELLELSTIEQGEIPLRMRELDLGAVIDDVIARLRPYADRQGVAVRSELPGDARDRLVTADQERVGQLLLNLVHNAIKFSRYGTDVAVRLHPAPGEVVVEVHDTGIGIRKQDLERVFERFYKADRARARNIGGTGLGLSISRHIAERHGGRVWAESALGRGSSFFVSLPRRGPPG